MNPHLAQPPEFAGAPFTTARLAALVVHGRGQDPGFMRGVLDRIGLDGVACVLPRAAGNTWYPASFLEPLEANQPRLDQALEACTRMLDTLRDNGFGPERTVLLGFSQGACLLAEHLVRHPRRYAGAALLTGGYVGPPGAPRTAPGDLAGTPVFLGSSRYDEWVPLERVTETARLLRELGGDVTTETYDDREHLVSDRAVAGARRVIENALPAPG
ncbi:phospholipase [Prauserella sp. PE36]|uniref:Phospholipase n=1 Tax=Prauserella endophytica TaxID=1592324 RepID=A0ABY2SBS2_9PSEU|nr:MULTISPECIES: phospholipase [Prauserella]PXY29481.1 phospholipase [Prauserella coralliicola]RBM21633.1 phospholipase [Prauserella sp. PE36]TKG72931.1 phospholipase [Prauserella endophytica]